MSLTFAILAAVTVLSAVAAVTLRNLVHGVLALIVAFAGVAALLMRLGAQFVGLAQILVYVGAVAILILFAVLLTRSGEVRMGPRPAGGAAWAGVVVAGLVGASLVLAVLTSPAVRRAAETGAAAGREATVKQIGMRLVTGHIIPLQVLGLLLTAALIGGVLVAMPDPKDRG